jgi:flagellar hook-basal body complex protein FliE
MAVTNVISSTLQGAGGERSFRHLEQAGSKGLSIGGPDEAGKAAGGDRPLQPDFLQMVNSFVSDVNGLQMQSGRAIDAFAAGEVTDVHQVMVAVQEAGLALDLLLEVRNRTMEAFQEVMRMQL